MKLPVDYTKLNWRQKAKVRDQYVKEQDGKCYYCGLKLSGKAAYEVRSRKLDMNLFPPGFLNNPVHLQHDHKSGMTEGAVHAYCNGVMWQYEGK